MFRAKSPPFLHTLTRTEEEREDSPYDELRLADKPVKCGKVDDILGRSWVRQLLEDNSVGWGLGSKVAKDQGQGQGQGRGVLEKSSFSSSGKEKCYR